MVAVLVQWFATETVHYDEDTGPNCPCVLARAAGPNASCVPDADDANISLC